MKVCIFLGVILAGGSMLGHPLALLAGFLLALDLYIFGGFLPMVTLGLLWTLVSKSVDRLNRTHNPIGNGSD